MLKVKLATVHRKPQGFEWFALSIIRNLRFKYHIDEKIGGAEIEQSSNGINYMYLRTFNWLKYFFSLLVLECTLTMTRLIIFM